MASTCVLDELRNLDETSSEEMSGSVFIAKRFELRNCRHKPSICSAECVASLIGTDNPHHYVAAVQNAELRKSLRSVLGVPLLFINRGVLLMEDPSKATIEFAHQKELSKLLPKEFELKALKKEEPKKEEEKKKKKKRGKKNPNPLSVKKPKTKSSNSLSEVKESEQKPKRKRHSKKKTAINN